MTTTATSAFTRIEIDGRAIRIRADRDASPQQALERTLARLYGKDAFMRPRNQEKWQDGGQTFRGWVDVYKPIRGQNSANNVASHVRIEVGPNA